MPTSLSKKTGPVEHREDELHLRHLHCDAHQDQGNCRFTQRARQPCPRAAPVESPRELQRAATVETRPSSPRQHPKIMLILRIATPPAGGSLARLIHVLATKKTKITNLSEPCGGCGGCWWLWWLWLWSWSNCGETTVFPDTPTGMSKPCPSTDSDPTSTISRDIDHQSLHTKGHVNDIVQTTKNCNCGSSAVSFTTALESWTGTTRTSTTLLMYCRRTSMSKSGIHSFLHCLDHPAPVVAQRRAKKHDLHNRSIDQTNTATAKFLWHSEQDHGNLPLRHDRK